MKNRWIRRVATLFTLCLLMNDNVAESCTKLLATGAESILSTDVLSASVSGNDLITASVSGNDLGMIDSEGIRDEIILEENNQILVGATADENALPSNVTEYIAQRDAGKTEFYIATAQDFLDAQNLCEQDGVNGFKDITLIITTPESGDGVWNLASVSSTTGFTGIGSMEHPFQGTLKCHFANDGGGVQFKLNKPIIANMGDGAKMTQMVIVCETACAAVAENISGDVTVTDVWLRGTIGNGSGTVGTIAANIADASSVTVSEVKVTGGSLALNGTTAGGIAGTIGNDTTVSLGANVILGASGSELTISGGTVGGIAGTVGSNFTLLMADSVEIGKTSQIPIMGTVAAGQYFGTITGNNTWNLAEQSKMNARVIANSNTCYAGQYAGKLFSDGTAGALTITGGNSVEARVSGAGNGGGLLGFCGQNMTITVPEGTFTISGSVAGADGSVGGVVGVMESPVMELANYTVSANVTGKWAGGIVGEMQAGTCIIKNPTISGTVSGTGTAGGVIGNVTVPSAIELQGTISVTNMPTGGTCGRVVGTQEKSLIYLSEIEGSLNGVSQITPVSIEKEIGTYGGVFRNQTVAAGKLIGDGTLANVGIVNHTVAKSGDSYQLTSAVDFEALAIVLGTEGVYGSNAFNGAAHTDLLAANYTVTANVDISYDKTGILTLNRNDKAEVIDYAFQGKMEGVDASITIEQSSTIKQSNAGLFTSITKVVEFSNLVFTGTVENANGVGGIAYDYAGSGTGYSLTLNNITMQKTFVNDTGWIGGVVGLKNSGNKFDLHVTDITLACTIDGGSERRYSGFISKLSNATVDIDGVTLGGALKSNTDQKVGGFIGLVWTNIGGTIRNVSVQQGTEYTTIGSFGVLWNEMTSRASDGVHVTLDTVKLDGLTVNASANKENCALVVSQAQQLVIDIVDYDSTGCVVNNPGNNFDEVVGINKNWGEALPINLGIVSLHSRAANFPEYHYENKVASLSDKTNKDTIYYYDLFQYLEKEDGSVNSANIISGNVLDSPAKVLLWNVVQMSTSSVRDTFKKYFAEGSVPSLYDHTYTFKGELDLSGISFYPTPQVQNGTYLGDNAKITFGAKTDTVDMGAWTLSNEDSSSQHYMLQSGLFSHHGGHNLTLNMSNITLSGQIANLGANSGAIITGTNGINGGGTFTDISLDNLWIADYNKEEQAGLIISKIQSVEVNFDGITMTNYPMNSDAKAAAALIGSAGDSGATTLVLSFQNMMIADDADTNDSQEHNGDVLAYASFLYSYDYTDDVEINEGSGIYLFSEADNAAGNVTYGLELDETTEFSDTSNTVFVVAGITDSSIYKPYVYQVESIEVNPKTGDILEGCGTYEDPYIIKDIRQFLTLYRYINEKDKDASAEYQYQTFYELGGGWKIIKVGTDSDSDFCETKHNVTWNGTSFTGDGAEDAVIFGDAEFPTSEELSRAYYRLEGDIDLTEIQNETYKMIAQEFVGFGTATRPFVGVWYGKGSDDVVHTVTLPDKTTSYPNYGFIQYAQGAVVKDMIIKTSANDEAQINDTITVRVGSSGGGVIATILGGDNIIDNVTVQADLMVASNYATIGGYVGVVKKGGLILRNVDNTADTGSLATFRLDQNLSPFLGAVVGKVEDGYVLYDYQNGETGSDVTSYYWEEKGGNTAYSAISNYTIFNGDYLKDAASGLMVANDNNKIVFTIPNETALQVMAMALSADALNVRPSDYTYSACGYTEKSRSRKAAYSDIGCTDSTTEDYLAAAQYDNVMGYSVDADKAYAYAYLYDYMGITDAGYLNYFVVDSNDKGHSILNPAELINGTHYVAKWELVENGSYDMSQFGSNFRGIGALYQTGHANGGTFHGNFDGKDNTITLDMEREILSMDGDIETVRKVGLFNTLYGCEESQAEIYTNKVNFDPTDKALVEASPSEVAKYCFVIENFKLAGSIDVSESSVQDVDVGGVVAEIVNAQYAFYNISVDTANPLKIGEVGSAKIDDFGGIIGSVAHDNYLCGYTLIQNCDFSGTADNKLVFKGAGSGGGLVGYSHAKVVKVLSSQVQYAEIHSSQYGGGMVGAVNNGQAIFEGTEATPIKVRNCSVGGWTSGGLVGRARDGLYVKYAECSDSDIGLKDNVESAGGLVGTAEKYLCVSTAYCHGITLKSYNNMGGMVGKATGYDSEYTSVIQDVTATDFIMREQYNYDGRASGIGGIVGRNDICLLIQNASVTGTKTDDTYTFRMESVKRARNAAAAAGGIVGYHTANTLQLNNCAVDTIAIKIAISASSTGQNISAGGIVGYVGEKVCLAPTGYITTENLKITAPCASDAANDIMAAGGCFGFVADNVTISTGDSTNKYYNGLSAISNTVTGKQAGGAIGYINNAGIRLSGVQVKDGSVVSDEIAGGLVGCVSPNNSGGAAFNDYNDCSEDTTNIVSGMKISGRIVGGAFGYHYGTGAMRVENVKVENNEIVAKSIGDEQCIAGGFIGASKFTVKQTSAYEFRGYHIRINNNIIVNEVQSTSLTGIDHLAAGGLIGKLVQSNKEGILKFDKIYIGEDYYGENHQDNTTNTIGIRQGASGAVMLVQKNGEAYELVDSVVLPSTAEAAKDYQAINILEQKYGYCVGSVIGVAEANNKIQFYLLCSDDTTSEFNTPVMTANSNPPVVDVGRTSTQGIDDYRENCHIIYGTTVANAEVVSTNMADMKTQVDALNSAYDSSDTLKSLLEEQRLSEDMLTIFEKAYQDNYQFPGTDVTIDFPIFVYRVQDGTLQEVMEQITDSMTNVAGAPSSDVKYLTITSSTRLCDGTTTSANTNGTASVSVSRESNELPYSFSSSQYDSLQDEQLTYTELTYTYGWSEDSVNHKKVFRIAVFVEEPILYGVHSKIMEGRVTDVDTIKENGVSETDGSLIMASDSDYTMLLEYSYGKARKQMADGVAVDKVFYLQQNNVDVSLPVGTQLLLVDVSNGNKPYYYTITQEDIDTKKTQIQFTDFKDSAGNSYINRDINDLPDATNEAGESIYTDLGGHTLTETGVETFLLTVLSNDNTQDRVYSIHSGIQIEDPNLESRFQLEADHTAETQWNVTAVPGITVQLVGDGVDTDISGMISKTEGLTIKAKFTLTAPAVYWTERNKEGSTLIDSSNNNKFLELAFYLRDSDNNRVRLPSGTNLSYKLTDGTYSTNKVIPDESLVYYYKDIRNQFAIPDFEYAIKNITGDTSVSVEFQLDFTGADLSGITQEHYNAWIELLRTANKDYPMGNGNMVDFYSETIEANATQELGFALRADHLEDLAINTYFGANTADTIPSHVMFDFNEILKAAGIGAAKDAVLEKWAGLDYEVTYQVYKKTQNADGTITYVPYSGTEIVVNATEGVKTPVTGSGSVTATYNFTAEQIDTGLVTFPCLITQDTASLTGEDFTRLTNYKIEATLKITEPGHSTEDAAEETKDFFIYTVTKLKLDL